MTDIVENFNFIKDIYFWNNSKRNIIGLYYNKIQPYNPSSDPFKKIIRKEPINEEVKNKCKSKWEECTNFNICNEMFNLNQESLYNNLNMNSEQLDFYIKNQNNIKFLELKDCIMPLLKKKVIQEEVALPQEVLPQEVLPQEVLPQEVLPQEVVKPLFINLDEFNKIYTEYKYKIIKFIDNNEVNIINNILNGVQDFKTDGVFNINSIITIIGGEYDGKKFYNRLNYIPLYNSYDDFLNPKNFYHLSTSLEVKNELLSMNDLFSKGMTQYNLVDASLKEKNWDINTEFIIIDGEYDGVIFKNKISDILSRNFPCNIIYKLPIIGKGICSKKDNSNFIILGVILFIILIVILFYIFSSKKNVLSLSEIKQIKLDKALQVKYP